MAGAKTDEGDENGFYYFQYLKPAQGRQGTQQVVQVEDSSGKVFTPQMKEKYQNYDIVYEKDEENGG